MEDISPEKSTRCCINMSVVRVLSPLRLSVNKHQQSGQVSGMSDGLVTPLKSVLTCPGCGQRYNDGERRPKFLSCFHTACMECLSKGFNKGKVVCPTCSLVTESINATGLPDNTQLCTILLNMSSLNLFESSANLPRETCPTHAARINFWCETCRLPVCRDCTVLAHRQSAGHKVHDHDVAITTLHAEITQALTDVRTLFEETKRLRHDHRRYLMRQLDACRTFEKHLKAELKGVDPEKKDETKAVDKLEHELSQCSSILNLHHVVQKSTQLRLQAAKEFASAKAIVADKILTLGKLNRSTDDLDSIGDTKFTDSGTPPSPNHSKRSRSLASRFLLSNGRAGRSNEQMRPTLSLEAPPSYTQPMPRVYLDFSIKGIEHTCRVVCELRPDKAPILSENFIRLCTGSRGFGFKGTKIFRCLPGWWIQGGDFESNDGEGGKSAMDDHLITTEATELEPRPGALEMLCVSANKRGKLMVGSQFFIHVKKYSYTNVFGFITDGLDLIERLSQLGQQSEVYKPTKEIHIVDSGLLKP